MSEEIQETPPPKKKPRRRDKQGRWIKPPAWHLARYHRLSKPRLCPKNHWIQGENKLKRSGGGFKCRLCHNEGTRLWRERIRAEKAAMDAGTSDD